MKKEDFEKYIGELSPEMQEKARQCKTKEELNALLAENDVELSEDALQAVAGGCTEKTAYCLDCGSEDIGHSCEGSPPFYHDYYYCRKCGSRRIGSH